MDQARNHNSNPWCGVAAAQYSTEFTEVYPHYHCLWPLMLLDEYVSHIHNQINDVLSF